MPIYFGMRVIITENHANYFVTRLVDFLTETSASFIPFQITLFLFVAIINMIAIFPVTNQQNDTYYPIRPVYSVTVAKRKDKPFHTLQFGLINQNRQLQLLCRHVTCSFLSMHLLFKAVHGKSFRTKSTIAYSFHSYFFSEQGAIGLHCSEGPAISKSLTMSCCYLFG